MKEIIPRPQSCILAKKGGTFDMARIDALDIDAKFSLTAPIIKDILEKGLGKKLGKEGEKVLKIGFAQELSPQSYRIECDENGISVSAGDAAGALYAVQSLRVGSMMGTPLQDLNVPCGKVNDYPRYSWRGLLLDESRHFFGEEEVKKLLDVMSMHKLNVLHWHLTDDQGWRIEIKKYPLLTEIGSSRPRSQIHGWGSTDTDDVPVSGFYTQEKIKEIVAYAAERGISVIPEIDMPAHFAAAMAAYPWLACRELRRDVHYYFGSKIPLSQGIRDWNRSACIGKPATLQFIKDVIDEVCELFPAPYFHIGGDEAPKDEWKDCPACQELIRSLGLKNEKQLQGWFTNEIAKYVRGKGRRLIGWNEILEGDNIEKDVIVQYWTPQKDGRVIRHVKNGGNAIISKHKYFYFDMPYAQYPLRNTYMFNPYFEGFISMYDNKVKGIEGALWTEWISTPSKLEFQLFPRMEALAEASWYGGPKNWKKFQQRVKDYVPLLDMYGLNYAKEEIYRPCNPFRRLADIKTWYGGNENVEYDRNDNKY